MPKKLVFEGQHDDEELLMLFRRHPIVMRKGFMIMLVLVVVGLVPALIFPTRIGYLWFGLLGLGLGGIVLFYDWIGWYYSVFIVSNQRLIQVTHKGLFNSSLVDVGLDKIQNINFEVGGFQQTIFGFGTIVVQTYVGDLVMEKIYHPEKIQKRLIKVIKTLGYGSFMDNMIGGDSSEKQT